MTWTLGRLLTDDPRPTATPDVHAWRRDHLTRGDGHPMALAFQGGFRSDRLGFAFASGYQAALRALVPTLPADHLAALCVTEAGGQHPRAIQTRLDPDGLLTGEKTFVTLGPLVDVLAILCTEGVDPAGRSRLRLALVSAKAPGVSLDPMPALPFAPGLPHATLTLRGAAPSSVLPGPGHARYAKPFRTLEDVYVHMALVGWLIALGRRSGWPPDALEALMVNAASLVTIADMAPTDPCTHRLLGGTMAQLRSWLTDREALWDQVDPTTRATWTRDRALLKIAQGVRDTRLRRARAATVTPQTPEA